MDNTMEKVRDIEYKLRKFDIQLVGVKEERSKKSRGLRVITEWIQENFPKLKRKIHLQGPQNVKHKISEKTHT